MMPRASICGGSYLNDGNAGSRYANLDNWPENSNGNLGARGRGDDRISARRRLRSRRSATGGTRLHDQGRWSARLSCLGEHTSRSGIAGRSRQVHGPALSRPAAGSFLSACGLGMSKRYRNLIGQITSPETMRRAYRLTSRGKRLTRGFLEFKEFDAINLDDLAHDMADGTYRPGKPTEFFILDPKQRLISALPFRDRIAQQALCLIIAPIFDRSLLPRSFACRPGKGTHAGMIAVQRDLRHLARRGPVYFLKTDFKAYFASIQFSVLWQLIEAKISCRATLQLIEAMVPRSGIGLPIGSLTSQIFANLYTGATLDRHLQQTLGEDYWFRYMDDLVVLGESSRHLRAIKESIEQYARAHLGLRFSKWSIASANRGINFLGYRIWATHKLLRRDSVTRAKRKIAGFRAAGDAFSLTKFIASWTGHAGWADSANLIRSLELSSFSTQRERIL